jgi:hypothetical protein
MAKKEEKFRIQIDLPTENGFLDIVEELADADNRTRKDYIENLLIKHVKKVTGWPKQNKKPG